MGSWGYGVMQDDDASDAHDDLIKLFNRNKSKDRALAIMMRAHTRGLLDSDTRLSILLGMYQAAWKCGWIDDQMIKALSKEIETAASLDRWSKGSPRDVQKRKASLLTFLAKLKTQPAKVKIPKKPTQRKAVLRKGDCLAYKLKSGKYAAYLVIDHDEVDPARRVETWGRSLVLALDYESDALPDLSVFQSAPILKVIRRSAVFGVYTEVACFWVYSSWCKEALPQITKIGEVTVRSDAPEGSNMGAFLTLVEDLLQRERGQ